MKLFCFLCRHKWSEWKPKVYSYGHYDQEDWWERSCLRCGKVEQSADKDIRN